MNKVVKVAGITVALAGALLLGGCNEEKKYNALKMEVLTSVETVQNMDTYLTGSQEEFVQKMEKAIPEIEKIEKDVSEKLKEMEKLSKDSVDLTNDYLMVKKKAQNISDRKSREIYYLEKAQRSLNKK